MANFEYCRSGFSDGAFWHGKVVFEKPEIQGCLIIKPLKKNILYLLVLLLLGGGAFWTWNRNRQKSTLAKLDLNFSVPDTASIDRIVITPVEKGGEKASLTRISPSQWKINDKYFVAPTLMELLLTTIRNVEMQRHVEPNEAKTVNEDILKRGKKVEIFVNGELYKTYWVGDDSPGNTGTYLRFEEGDPYVCHLRGFLGFLSPRYNVSENDWRDKLLFFSSPQTLQSVEIQYPASPVDNFKISVAGKNMVLEAAGPFDTLSANGFLGNFKKMYVERHINTIPRRFRDSLLRTSPEWTLEVVDSDKAFSHRVDLYEVKDPDRQLGHIAASEDWFTIQNRVLYPVKLRKRDFLNRGK